MSEDNESNRAVPAVVGEPEHAVSRLERTRSRRKATRRKLILLALATVVGVGAVIVFMQSHFFGQGADKPTDYVGGGKSDVIIQVHPGDSTTTIAEAMVAQKVVAGVKVFVDASRNNAAIAAIQPGFYQMKTEMSAAAAVKSLANPQNRVGKMVIPEGRQLDDIAAVGTDHVTDGIFTLISDASCVELNGQQKCVAAADLRKAAQEAAPEVLKVPDWAMQAVNNLPNNHRRLEGLIAPGTWNVDPTGSPEQILATLIADSADHYVEGGLLDTATTIGMSPYEILVVGSLVQKEAKPNDFAKVARVIYNRLAEPQRLEFDSTVNYPLDQQEVATTDDARAQVTPWNTYASDGLPATPICSPGDEALAAAEHPEPGDWLYFVTVDTDGTTLFTRDYEQHLANIEVAQQNGILDSAR